MTWRWFACLLKSEKAEVTFHTSDMNTEAYTCADVWHALGDAPHLYDYQLNAGAVADIIGTAEHILLSRDDLNYDDGVHVKVEQCIGELRDLKDKFDDGLEGLQGAVHSRETFAQICLILGEDHLYYPYWSGRAIWNCIEPLRTREPTCVLEIVADQLSIMIAQQAAGWTSLEFGIDWVRLRDRAVDTRTMVNQHLSSRGRRQYLDSFYEFAETTLLRKNEHPIGCATDSMVGSDAYGLSQQEETF